MEKVPITIIGGGVIGCAIAYELSKYYNGIFLVEKNPILGDEQSSRNSGVIHAGIYYEKTPLKRKLCIEGNRLLYDFCEKYDIPFARTGKFVVATDKNEDKVIDRYIQNALSWGVAGMRKVFSEEIKSKEPNVYAISALWCSSTGLLDVPSYIQTLAKLAKEQGVEILKQTKITNIRPEKDCFILTAKYATGGEELFVTKILINAAGLFSDEIAKMVNPDSPYEIVPVRGEYYRFNSSLRTEINISGTNIYPVQELYYINDKKYLGLGVHLTPTFDITTGKKKVLGKNVLVGPTSIPVDSKTDYTTCRQGPEYFIKKVNKFFPNLRVTDLEIDYAGNRAKLKEENDFIIQCDTVYPNAIHLIGIDSPGLTASLSISKHVRKIIATKGYKIEGLS